MDTHDKPTTSLPPPPRWMSFHDCQVANKQSTSTQGKSGWLA